MASIESFVKVCSERVEHALTAAQQHASGEAQQQGIFPSRIQCLIPFPSLGELLVQRPFLICGTESREIPRSTNPSTSQIKVVAPTVRGVFSLRNRNDQKRLVEIDGTTEMRIEEWTVPTFPFGNTVHQTVSGRKSGIL